MYSKASGFNAFSVERLGLVRVDELDDTRPELYIKMTGPAWRLVSPNGS